MIIEYNFSLLLAAMEEGITFFQLLNKKRDYNRLIYPENRLILSAYLELCTKEC